MNFSTIEIIDLMLLFFLMLGLGCTIEFEQFKNKFRKPTGIIVGLFSQFVVMPAVAYGIAIWLLDGQPLLQVALLLVACSPGGALSNILSWAVGADLSLSIAMTTSSSIVSIGMLPLNLFLYIQLTGLGDKIKIDFGGIILSVVVIIVGTFVGIFIRFKSMKIAKWMGSLGGLAGVVLVLLGLVANSESDTPIWAQSLNTYLAAFLTSLIGLIVGLGLSLLAKLPKPSCVAVSLETAIQNKVIAVAIIGITFTNKADKDEASAIPLIYAFFALVLAVVWSAIAWKLGYTSHDPKLNLCQLLVAAKASVSDTESLNGVNDSDHVASADKNIEMMEEGANTKGLDENGKQVDSNSSSSAAMSERA